MYYTYIYMIIIMPVHDKFKHQLQTNELMINYASSHLPMPLGAPSIPLRELRHTGQAEGNGGCLGLGQLRLAEHGSCQLCF